VLKVLFVSSGNKDIPVNPFIKNQGESLKDNGIDVNYFFVNGKGIFGYLKNVSKLRREITKNGYNIIHAHYTYSGWLALLTFSGIPVILSFMGSDVYGSVDSQGRPLLKGRVNYFLSKLIQPFVEQIIVKSKNLSKYVYLKNKMSIIPNGVNFKVFKSINKDTARDNINIISNKKQILFLGKKSNLIKNFSLVTDSLMYLNKNEYELMPFDYPVPKEKIPLYINAADVVVLTSYLEGSPNIVKESMACNVPVVSVDVGDVKEVIGNTKGCFVTEYNPRDFSEKIKLAVNFDKTTGRDKISNLEINLVANQIIRIYRKCT
jgi:teichuronic acid biosynthesis glycosyltransferase TuaC